MKISQEYDMSFDAIGLASVEDPSIDYSHHNNSKTLQSLNIQKFNHFKVKEVDIPVND